MPKRKQQSAKNAKVGGKKAKTTATTGCKADVKSTGNKADVKSTGSKADVKSTGNKADVKSTGSKADVKSTGSKANVKKRGKQNKVVDGSGDRASSDGDTRTAATAATLSTAGEISAADVSVPPADIMTRVDEDFFDVECETLARCLLGARLVRRLPDGTLCWGQIVETEAYLGGDDQAAHSHNGKQTARNKAMFMDPGTIYVYHIYGTYTCINFSSKGHGAAVLVRAVEVQGDLPGATLRRSAAKKKPSSTTKAIKTHELGNGPSKLTMALAIDKATFDQQSALTCPHLWVAAADPTVTVSVVTSSRVGVDYAGEWAKKPLRFYVKDNRSVSVRDKEAEKTAESSKTV